MCDKKSNKKVFSFFSICKNNDEPMFRHQLFDNILFHHGPEFLITVTVTTRRKKTISNYDFVIDEECYKSLMYKVNAAY